uniref:S-protein homolog n=2 Tax=Physcomitrium patens TaxID=3218 RepID=A0A7I4E6N8_PHYPA
MEFASFHACHTMSGKNMYTETEVLTSTQAGSNLAPLPRSSLLSQNLSLIVMDLKLGALLSVTLAALMISGPLLVNAQASVELVNLIGDPVTTTCVADNANRPSVTIAPMGTEFWEFNGDMLSLGWTCHFEWSDSSDCAAGPTCKLHTQDVKVWQGVMGHRKLVGAIALTPCASCIWQIKFDGFYRADKKDMAYSFVVGWN